jgi:hypothetical protein
MDIPRKFAFAVELLAWTLTAASLFAVWQAYNHPESVDWIVPALFIGAPFCFVTFVFGVVFIRKILAAQNDQAKNENSAFEPTIGFPAVISFFASFTFITAHAARLHPIALAEWEHSVEA